MMSLKEVSKRSRVFAWMSAWTFEQKTTLGSLVVAGICAVIAAQSLRIQSRQEAELVTLKHEAAAPKPYIEAPYEPIKVKGPREIFPEGQIKLRNVGKGNCYNLHVNVAMSGLISYNGKKQLGLMKFDTEPQNLVPGITLPAGETRPLGKFDYPIALSKDAQYLCGYLTLDCEDEYGNPHHYIQPFNSLAVVQPTEFWATLNFAPVRKLTAPDYSTVLYGMEIKLGKDKGPTKPALSELFKPGNAHKIPPIEVIK